MTSTITASPVAGRTTRADWFVLALLAMSLGLNVLLGIGVYRFSSRVTQSEVRQQAGPAVGATVPPLDVQRRDGTREVIKFESDKRPTLVYVFTPTCVWCERNLANFRAVVAAGSASYRIIGLSLAPDVDDYLTKTKLDLPVYVEPSQQTVAAFGLGPTPQTFVIATDGKILKTWRGAYVGANKRDVEGFLGLKLPGLQTPDTASRDNLSRNGTSAQR